MPAKHPPEFAQRIRKGRSRGLTDVEIAKEMSVKVNAVRVYRLRHIGHNKNYQQRIIKHKPLREKVMRYFLTHSADQCMRRFKLSLSEFKSLQTLSYRMPELKHLRKDSRRKDKWDEYEIKTMLQHIGLRPLKVIAKIIDRGNSRVIKEKLQNLGVKAPKYLNGLTLSRYRSLFGVEPEFLIETDAGPNGGIFGESYFKIIPWVYINDQILQKEINPPKIIKRWVLAMADFQEWVHDGDAYANLMDISLMIGEK